MISFSDEVKEKVKIIQEEWSDMERVRREHGITGGKTGEKSTVAYKPYVIPIVHVTLNNKPNQSFYYDEE